MSLSIPITLPSLSSSKSLSVDGLGPQFVSLSTKLSQISLTTLIPFKSTPIRMGGGPRTYPGGVSKWQWKRMQANKAKQLLKARLARERQIYEMRKRAELKAAISELERPWEKVEKPPNLFSVSADEQLKVLADRFQKPGGLDLWSEKDGPELFRSDNGLPSARFFPKGIVHSVKPYGKLAEVSASEEKDSVSNPTSGSAGKMSHVRKRFYKNSRNSQNQPDKGGKLSVAKKDESRILKEKVGDKGSGKATRLSNSKGINSGWRNHRQVEFRRRNSDEKGVKMDSEVFDMSLQNDGKYGFELEL